MRIRLAVTKSTALCQQWQTWRSFVDLLFLFYFTKAPLLHYCSASAVGNNSEMLFLWVLSWKSNSPLIFKKKIHPWDEDELPHGGVAHGHFFRNRWVVHFSWYRAFLVRPRKLNISEKITTWKSSFDLHYWCWTVAQLRIVWHNESKSSSLVSKM